MESPPGVAVLTQRKKADPSDLDEAAEKAFNGNDSVTLILLKGRVEDAFNDLYAIFVPDPTKRKPLDLKISRGTLSNVVVGGKQYKASMTQKVSLNDRKLRPIEFSPKFKVNWQLKKAEGGRLYCGLRVLFEKDGEPPYRITGAYLYHNVAFKKKQRYYVFPETHDRDLNEAESAADFLVDAKLVITEDDATGTDIEAQLKAWADACPSKEPAQRKTIDLTAPPPGPNDLANIADGIFPTASKAHDGAGAAEEAATAEMPSSRGSSRPSGTDAMDAQPSTMIADAVSTAGMARVAGGGARAAGGVKFFGDGKTTAIFAIGNERRNKISAYVEVKQLEEDHKLGWRYPYPGQNFRAADIYTDGNGDEFFKIDRDDGTVLEVYYRWRNPRESRVAKLYQQSAQASGHEGGGAAEPLPVVRGPGAEKAAQARILNEAETLALGGHTLLTDTAVSIVDDVEMKPGELSERMSVADFERMFRLRGGRQISLRWRARTRAAAVALSLVEWQEVVKWSSRFKRMSTRREVVYKPQAN